MGAVFSVFAGFYYWVKKISGANYREKLGQYSFWLMFVGVNITFFPMHFLGLAGMPRRVPDYADEYLFWNIVASYGSLISVFSVVVFFYLVMGLLTNEQLYGWFRTNNIRITSKIGHMQVKVIKNRIKYNRVLSNFLAY